MFDRQSKIANIKDSSRRLKMKTIKEELLRWTCKTHATNSYLDRRVLREKALELSRIRGLNGFKCSEKWLNKFLKDHGFSYNLTDRRGPMFNNYRDWIELMRPTIIKYHHNDLFHVDELTMYTDILPSAVSSENEMQNSSMKKRVTVLLGCNSTGSMKLPLLVCGSYSSGITFKEHVYWNTEDSRIGDELFKNWLSDVNERMFKSNRKILVFLHRSRMQALKDFAPSNLKLVYLPENFPPLLRPLRKEVFHYIKMIFRRKFAEQLKQGVEEWSLQEILKSLIDAWTTIPREIIVFSFQRTQFRTDDSFLQIDCDCWDQSKMGISFKRFVTFDDNLSDTPQFYIPSNQYHGYNLRKNKCLIQLDRDSPDLETEGSDVLTKKSPSNTDLNYQELSGSGANQKLNKAYRESRRSLSRKKKSRKRAYSETRFKSKDRNNKNDFVSWNCRAASSRSIYGKMLKWREEPQSLDIKCKESLKAIVDKALTLTSLVNVEYTKKLIDSIHASLQEISVQTSNTKSYVKDPETKRRKMKEEVHEAFVNFDHLQKGNQPSTSKDELYPFAEDTMEKDKVTFKKTRDLDAGKCENDESPSVSNFKRKKIHVPEESPSSSEPSEKKLKGEHNWTKQFETTFVFGPQNANCSNGTRHDDKVVDSCIFNVKPSFSPKD